MFMAPDTALSFPPELLDILEIQKPLASSDHNQVHFNIHIRANNNNKQSKRRNI